jgi:membrane protease YdiL (CAAX protease family)
MASHTSHCWLGVMCGNGGVDCLDCMRNGILAFLLITFGVAWTWLFTARLGLGLSVVNPIVQLPMGFAPAVAAIVVRRWVTREGFGDAGLALNLRRGLSSYLVAWLGPPVLAAATVGLAAALGLWRPALDSLTDADSGVSVLASLPLLLVSAVILTPVYWGEEFGWTGYLRLRLYPDRPLRSVLATGLIWAVWHYPLAFLGYIDFDNVAFGLVVWTVSMVFQEVLLSWLRLRSGTVWPASLAHAGNNMVFFLLTGQLLGRELDDTGTTVLTAVPLGIVACCVLIAGGQLAVRRPAGAPETAS